MKDEQPGDAKNQDDSHDPATMFIMGSGNRMFVGTDVIRAEVTGDVLTMSFNENRVSTGNGMKPQPATTAVLQKQGRQMLVSGGALAQFASKPTLVQLCRRE